MKKTFLFLLLTLSTFSASANIYLVKATLNGASMVPATNSAGTGTLTGTFDSITGEFNYTMTYTGLSASVGDISLHLGAAGTNGSYISSLNITLSPSSGAITLSSTHISSFIAGNTYVKIWTNSTYYNGEIRGQLTTKGTETFNEVTKNIFFGIGGYAYKEDNFPASGSLGSPYVRSGPLPNNDFMFVATTADSSALRGSLGRLSTLNSNRSIILSFRGNNVRKVGLNVYEEDANGALTNGSINATITTNLNNIVTLTSTNGARFVGFRVILENEYIVSITFSSNVGFFTSLDNIIFGDDTPQNVSLNFDGVDDNITLPNTIGNFSTTQNFTVSCWVKPAVTQSDLASIDVSILEKWDGVGGAYPFVIRYYNENYAYPGRITAARYNGIAGPSIMSSVSIDDNKWHHIAFVVDAVGMKLYIDGVLSASGNNFTAAEANTPCTNTTPLYIGSRNTIRHFKGEIDEIRLWTVAKTATEIQNEMFCKNPNTTNLQAAYNFNNGVPNSDNTLITQVQDAVGNNHGTLNSFAKTGDASNWVNGQIKHVKRYGSGNNGSSWATAINLPTAITTNSCNDLFDIYLAPTSGYQEYQAVTIPAGTKIYGGFAGTEKNINERNKALIHSTNRSTISGDNGANDSGSFDITRNDNALNVVTINGNDVTLDGLTVNAGQTSGVYNNSFGNLRINNCRIVSNGGTGSGGMGLNLNQGNATLSNCLVAANKTYGLNMFENSTNFQNCVIVNNGATGVYLRTTSANANINSNFTNCTIASNYSGGIFMDATETSISITNNIKNTIIRDNRNFGILINSFGTTNNNIRYSLIQGETGGTNGNLNGNTVNPQFVSPVANTIRSDGGNYRLKWCSLAINAGTNTGITPLDLDRNARNFNGTADMGAYEFLGNTPSPTNDTNSTIAGTIDSPTYAGGAIQTITSDAKILAPAGAIDFKAPNSITLNPGFEARGMGQYFKAQIGANVSCSN